MKRFLRIAGFFALCVLSAPSIAGVEKDSHTTRAGLFFAWLSPDDGYVSVSFDVEEKLRKLAHHCNAGRAVYSLQRGTRYNCKVIVFKTESGMDYWDSAGVTVQGPVPKSERQFGLFSITPPHTTDWVARKLLPDELSALNDLLNSDSRRYGA